MFLIKHISTILTIKLFLSAVLIWHQWLDSEVHGKSYQANTKNTLEIFRIFLIYLGTWQSIAISLAVRACSLQLFHYSQWSRKILHFYTKASLDTHIKNIMHSVIFILKLCGPPKMNFNFPL